MNFENPHSAQVVDGNQSANSWEAREIYPSPNSPDLIRDETDDESRQDGGPDESERNRTPIAKNDD